MKKESESTRPYEQIDEKKEILVDARHVDDEMCMVLSWSTSVNGRKREVGGRLVALYMPELLRSKMYPGAVTNTIERRGRVISNVTKLKKTQVGANLQAEDEEWDGYNIIPNEDPK